MHDGIPDSSNHQRKCQNKLQGPSNLFLRRMESLSEGDPGSWELGLWVLRLVGDLGFSLWGLGFRVKGLFGSYVVFCVRGGRAGGEGLL